MHARLRTTLLLTAFGLFSISSFSSEPSLMTKIQGEVGAILKSAQGIKNLSERLQLLKQFQSKFETSMSGDYKKMSDADKEAFQDAATAFQLIQFDEYSKLPCSTAVRKYQAFFTDFSKENNYANPKTEEMAISLINQICISIIK